MKLCSEKILELIEKKNEKFPYYDTLVDECWLVIVRYEFFGIQVYFYSK